MFSTRRLIVMILAVSAGMTGASQQPDSLFAIYNDFRPSDPGNSKDKISWLNEVGDSYQDMSKFSKALEYYNKALEATVKARDKKAIAAQHIRIGNLHVQTTEFNNALRSYQQAIIIYEQLNDYNSIGETYFRISRVYRGLSDFSHQLEYLQKTMKWYEKAGNNFELAKTYREAGYYYMNIPYNPKAVYFFLNSLTLFEKLGAQKQTAEVLGDLGHVYLLMKDGDQAFEYLQRALILNQQVGNKSGMATNYWILGDYYFRAPADIVSARDCFEKALALFNEFGPKDRVAYVYLNIAEMYVLSADTALAKANVPISEKYLRAIDYQKKAIQIFKAYSPESELLVPLYSIMSAYIKINRYDSAYSYQKQYIDLRDKIFSVENQKDIVRLETKHDREKYEDSLKLDKQITDEKLQQQLLRATQQQQQLALQENQLMLTNREKDLQSLAYEKSNTDLQNEQLKRQEKERQLELAEAEQKLQAANQQRQIIYGIIILILLIAGALYFIYRTRLRNARLEGELVLEKAEQQQMESEFQQRLADVSLTALRSQMNPHFIFNCLNSIKLYTLQNDSSAASAYLVKFSKLIRLVLENSRSDRISLASELEALELYIEMEAMRFKEKLSYQIVVAKEVESDYIEIPPLLLQPYVENAIWHGLMQREEGGHIDIAANLCVDQSLLEITIADNGIGRTRAAELKSKTATKHNSYGMKATSERIALINQIYKTGASVEIQDLFDNRNIGAGTKVIIKIPV